MEKEKGIDFAHSTFSIILKKFLKKDIFMFLYNVSNAKTLNVLKVCPVKATWQEPDGIIVVDYNWCIGCRYCMAACPYGARHFNWGEPNVPVEEINPEMHYLGNRPRIKGCGRKMYFLYSKGQRRQIPCMC